MREKLTQFDFIIIILALLSVFIFIYLYPQVYPTAAIKLPLEQTEILERANDIIADFGYEVHEYDQQINFFQDQKQVEYLYKNFERKEANRFLSDIIPANYWRVRWVLPESIQSITIRGSQEEKVQTTVKRKLLGRILMNLSPKGELLKFEVSLADSVKGKSLPDTVALRLAQANLSQKLGLDWSGFSVLNQQEKKLEHRIDHVFRWRSQHKVAGETIEREVVVQGERIGGYNLEYILPLDFKVQGNKVQTLKSILAAFIFIIYIIGVIIVLVQKLKADSISILSGLLFGVILAVAMIIIIWSSAQDEGTVAMVIAYVIPPLFLGFVIMVLFAVGDAVARDVWHEKLYTFDALKKGFVLFPRFANVLIRAFACSLVLIGFITIGYYLGIEYFDVLIRRDNSEIVHFTSFSPLLYYLANVISEVFFQEIVFRLITISYLRKYFRSTLAVILISGSLSALSAQSMNGLNASSYIFDFILIMGFSCFLADLFIKFDFLTVLITSTMVQLFFEGYNFLNYGSSVMHTNGYIVFTFFGGLLLLAFIGKFKKPKAEIDLARLAPPYVAKITERERLKRELEIARNVQLSFLPKETPRIPGVEVASICIPAKEVGGDYYDFVLLDPDRLAIVIGDVSGKGISAAFYMTLMKGLLRAQARNNLSPREVLIQLNSLFYENVDSGTFISMIYGVFDLKQKTFTFARAGHNPILLKRKAEAKVLSLYPKGMALGLEAGTIFNQTIEELKIGITANDYYIFFTDGFSEAMNQQREEFGEEKLQTLIENISLNSSEQILEDIRKQVERFVGKAPQHDDMTMVILKILE